MTDADFKIPGFERRLVAFLTGRVDKVHARRAPVLIRYSPDGNGGSVDAETLRSTSDERYLPGPMIVVELDEGTGSTPHSRKLRDTLRLLDLCLDALEGRDGADVLTELAVAGSQLRALEGEIAAAICDECGAYPLEPGAECGDCERLAQERDALRWIC